MSLAGKDDHPQFISYLRHTHCYWSKPKRLMVKLSAQYGIESSEKCRMKSNRIVSQGNCDLSIRTNIKNLVMATRVEKGARQRKVLTINRSGAALRRR